MATGTRRWRCPVASGGADSRAIVEVALDGVDRTAFDNLAERAALAAR